MSSFLRETRDCVFTLPENLTNVTVDGVCDTTIIENNLAVNLLFSLLMLIVLVTLTRRSDTNTPPRNCCWGRPGFLFPLNMLDGYEYRLAYCAAFGSMTFDLASLLWNQFGLFSWFGFFFKDSPVIKEYPVLRILILLIQVGAITLHHYPLFFALATKYKLIGGVLGLFFMVGKMLYTVHLSICIDTEYDVLRLPAKKNALAIVLWPIIVCQLILTGQYVFNIGICIRDRKFLSWEYDENAVQPHHVEHVKYLLGKLPLPWKEDNMSHLSIFHPKRIWGYFKPRHIPGFRFPTRVLATFTVTVMCVYQIMVEVALYVYYVLALFKRSVICGEGIIPAELFDLVKDYVDVVVRYAELSVNLWTLCLVLNSFLLILYVYSMCLNYRDHTLRVYRGDWSIFPVGWARQSSDAILASASRHSGLQIAYTIWGFVIIQVFTFALVMALAFLIFIPPIDFQYWGILIHLLQTVVATLILNMLLVTVQKLLARFFYLQDKIEKTDDKLHLAIDNRKSWYNMSFFFFFWNLFLGVISALLRVLRGIVFGIFFIPRIDRPVLMKGFESFDTGFVAYLSLLSLIHTHDHPVVKVFVKVLADGVNRSRLSQYKETSIDELENGKCTSNTAAATKRARYYWFLAYTLIHNPDLINYRKVDDPDDNDPTSLVKHKIVLAAHRKRKGMKTSELYN